MSPHLSSLFFLLLSTAGAFSPAAVPRTHSNNVAYTPRHLPCRVVAHRRRSGAASNANSLSFNVNSNERTSITSSSLAMSTAASPEIQQRQFTRKKRTAMFMAFMTGWADWLFIKKFNFFGTMMTGNSMKMAAAIVDGRIRDTVFFLSIIISYMVGVGTFRRAELSLKDKALNGVFAPIVAGCFLWSDYLGWTKPTCAFLPAILLSFAWGIINSVGSEVTGTLMFVLTGAMTRFSNFIVDRISRTAGRKKIPKEGMLMSLSVIGGFILGAAWSAFLVKSAPKLITRGVFSIMGGIYGLLFLWLDRDQFGAWYSRKNGKLCEIDADEVDCVN